MFGPITAVNGWQPSSEARKIKFSSDNDCRGCGKWANYPPTRNKINAKTNLDLKA